MTSETLSSLTQLHLRPESYKELHSRVVRDPTRPNLSIKIGVIAELRYLRQEMPGAMIRAFSERGLEPDVICPQGSQFDPQTGGVLTEDGRKFDLNNYDVIISRNRNGLGLSMLSYAQGAGIPTFNTPDAIARVRNKAQMAIALCRASVLCPPTILAESISVLSELSSDWFPLILKATYGDNSQGLRIIRDPADLAEIHWDDDPVLAQRFLFNNGFDLKLYVCGETVFAARKPSPINGDPSAGVQPLKPSRSMVKLALKAGKIFGLEIYGVDVVETKDGLYVIEVNDFPNFTSVSGAAERICDYILTGLAESPRRDGDSSRGVDSV